MVSKGGCGVAESDDGDGRKGRRDGDVTDLHRRVGDDAVETLRRRNRGVQSKTATTAIAPAAAATTTTTTDSDQRYDKTERRDREDGAVVQELRQLAETRDERVPPQIVQGQHGIASGAIGARAERRGRGRQETAGRRRGRHVSDAEPGQRHAHHAGRRRRRWRLQGLRDGAVHVPTGVRGGRTGDPHTATRVPAPGPVHIVDAEQQQRGQLVGQRLQQRHRQRVLHRLEQRPVQHHIAGRLFGRVVPAADPPPSPVDAPSSGRQTTVRVVLQRVGRRH